MNSRYLRKILLTVMLIMMTVAYSGCIKRLSDPYPAFTSTHESVSQLKLGNPIGKTEVRGSVDLGDQVHVETTVRVETYSLFGLGNPNSYLDSVAIVESVEDGVLTMDAAVKPRSFVDRLLVRVLPSVERSLVVPAAVTARLKTDMGNLDLINLVGDVTAELRVGEMTVTSEWGVFGAQEYKVNVGTLALNLPENASFRYDLKTAVGDADVSGFGMEARGFIGASAAGNVGYLDTPSSIVGRVDIGNIVVNAR